MPPTLQRPPRLIGRQAELRQAGEALAKGQAVLLLGEAGLGKSRLIAELLRGATAHTAVGVSARPGDAAVPYATLARLLRQLLERRELALPHAPGTQALARLLPELRPEAGAEAARLPLPPDGARLVLQAAVCALLAGADLRQVAVDDLHFADEASIELLHALLDEEPLRHIGWLLAQRPAEGAAAAQALRDGLVESGRLCGIALAPLTQPDTVELLRSLDLPGLDADAWAPRLHRHTGGNPLFLLETAEQVAVARHPVATLARKARIRGVLSAAALLSARIAPLAEAFSASPRAIGPRVVRYGRTFPYSVLRARKMLARASATNERVAFLARPR